MDDSNQKQNQDQSDDQLQQPKIQPQHQSGGGVGAPVKEQEPIPGGGDLAAEHVRPSETEPNIDEELKETGVKTVTDTPKIDEELKKIGVTHAKESTPVMQNTHTLSKLFRELHAKGAEKISPDNSVRWFFEEVKKAFKKSPH